MFFIRVSALEMEIWIVQRDYRWVKCTGNGYFGHSKEITGFFMYTE
jgi:hypothetical protein